MDEIRNVATILGLRAEKLLKSSNRNSEDKLTILETLNLIYELEVYQIELEMQKDSLTTQNEALEMQKDLLEIQKKELIGEKVISKNTLNKYINLYDFSPLGYLSLNKTGEIIDLNLNVAHKLGKERSGLKNSRFGFLVSDESRPAFNNFLEIVFDRSAKAACDLQIATTDDRLLFLHLSGLHFEKEDLCYVSVMDITQRKEEEKYKEMTRDLLQILNEPGDTKDSIHKTLEVLKSGTGFEALGIRLQVGNDFPYADQLGFAPQFIFTENSLLEFDKMGKACCDAKGHFPLACTCGLVLSGKAAQTASDVTPGGSYWTNDSRKTLDVAPAGDTRYNPRNTCIHQGYASMALVPIRNNGKIMGLIQFNDKRTGQLNRYKIEILEGIAMHLGAIVMRRQSEEALRKNEELLRTITGNVPDIIIQLSEKGTILYMNRALSGYAMKESIGKNFCALSTPENHEKMSHALQLVFSEASTQTYYSRVVNLNGEMHWYLNTLSPVKEGTEVKNAILIIHELTDIIQAKKTLRASEDKRNAILRSAMDGFWIADRQGSILEVNDAYCRMSGYSRTELLTKRIRDLKPAIIGYNLALHLDNIVALGEDRFETCHLCKDGSIIDVEVSVQFRTVDGGQFVTFLHNITERKATEKALFERTEQFRLLFENSLDAILFTNPDGSIYSVNPEGEKMFGRSKEEIISLHRNDLNDVNDPRLKPALEERQKTGRFKGELNYLRNDGTSFPVEITTSLFHDSAGIEKSSIIVRDITERKQAEVSLLQSELHYRTLFNSMIEGFCEIEMIFDENMKAVDYRFLKTNSTYEEQTGLVDVDGKLVCDLVPDIEDFWIEMYGKIALTGEGVHFENESKAMNKWFDVRAFRTGGEGSHKVAVSFNDITISKQAEELLRINNLRLSLALQSGDMAWWEMDISTGNVIYSNKKVEMLGYGPEGFTNYRDFVALVHPEDNERCMDAMRQHYTGEKEKYEVEYRIKSKSGEYIWCADIGTINKRDEKGSPLSISGIAYNINERKLTEGKLLVNNSRLTLAMKVSNMAWWEMDIASGAIIFEKRKAEMLGYDPKNFHHYRDFMQFVHPEDAVKIMDSMQQHIHGKEDKYEGEYRIKALGGDYKWFYDIGSVTKRDVNGKPILVTGLVMNVTERKKAEQALQKSEKDLTDIYDSMSEGLSVNEMIYDTKGNAVDYKLMDVNPAFEKITNQKRSDLLGPTRVGRFSMEEAPFFELYAQVAATGIPVSFEILYPPLNKYLSVSAFSPGKGKFVALFRDITEIKQAENALLQLNEELEARVDKRTADLVRSNEVVRGMEEKYRTVANFATNWEFWIDGQSTMLYCSPSCERISGYTAHEFMLNSQLILDIIYPEDLDIFKEHMKHELTAHVCDHEIQYRIVRKDGALRWVGHFCQPVLDASGNFKGIRGSNKDITARKKTEELLSTSNKKYRLLSENITDGIFICENGCFKYVNDAMYAIFGYEGKELEGVPLIRLLQKEGNEKMKNILFSTKLINSSYTLEIECVKKDHSVIYVEILLNYVSKEKMVYGVIHDITEKRDIQKNIIKAIIQTEEKERSHFAKELHEGLGPLLSTIKLYLQWSVRHKGEEKRIEIVGKAEDILDEAITTVKEISVKLSPHLLINHGLNSAIRNFVDKLTAPSTYNIIFESNLNRRIDFDIEAALYRAVIECINNSMKYSMCKNISIKIEDIGTQIQIQYNDDGIGFNISETMAKQKGLGLFNLQNRIKSIGGTIDMKSVPDKGVDYLFRVEI